MRLSKKLRGYLDSLETVTWELDIRSKHPKIKLSWPGGKRFFLIAKTPSDWRGELNVLAAIRRLMRAEGIDKS